MAESMRDRIAQRLAVLEFDRQTEQRCWVAFWPKYRQHADVCLKALGRPTQPMKAAGSYKAAITAAQAGG